MALKMKLEELLEMASLAKTSKVQFKLEFPHKDSIAKEIVAMSISMGGIILIGIAVVTGQIIGLLPEQIEEYDRQISQISDT